MCWRVLSPRVMAIRSHITFKMWDPVGDKVVGDVPPHGIDTVISRPWLVFMRMGLL